MSIHGAWFGISWIVECSVEAYIHPGHTLGYTSWRRHIIGIILEKCLLSSHCAENCSSDHNYFV